MNVVLATPPGWRVLDLDAFADVDATRAQIATAVSGHIERGDEFADTFAELALNAVGSGVFFAAMSVPGREGATDLTSVTLALPKPSSPRGTTVGSSLEAVATPARDGVAPVATEPGPGQNAVILAAGAAARVELSHRLGIGGRVSLPVFCVEYAVTVPDSDSVIVLAFTTIAPSDIDGLRAQFADIASTLAFA